MQQKYTAINYSRGPNSPGGKPHTPFIYMPKSAYFQALLVTKYIISKTG